jgi:antirestriction protein ArdC
LNYSKTGTVPWHKPWGNRRFGIDAFPRNAISKRHYRGINVFILASQSYDLPYWLTYKEAIRLGGHIRKGEHGTPIVFWKWLSKDTKTPVGGIEERHFPMLRYYTVFNAEQTEGCRLPTDASNKIVKSSFNPIEACEAVYANMSKRPQLEHGATQTITRGQRFEAYYTAGSDTVVMPRREAFDSPEFYYSVLFHELTHSTGAVHRLNRPTLNQAMKIRRYQLLQRGINGRDGRRVSGRPYRHRTSNADQYCGLPGQLDQDAQGRRQAGHRRRRGRAEGGRLHPEPAKRNGTAAGRMRLGGIERSNRSGHFAQNACYGQGGLIRP